MRDAREGCALPSSNANRGHDAPDINPLLKTLLWNQGELSYAD